MAEMFFEKEYYVRYQVDGKERNKAKVHTISVLAGKDLQVARKLAAEHYEMEGNHIIDKIEIIESTRRLVVDVTVLESFPPLPLQKS